MFPYQQTQEGSMFPSQQPQETTFEKIKRIATEAAWVIGTSIFVLAFPIYMAHKLSEE